MTGAPGIRSRRVRVPVVDDEPALTEVPPWPSGTRAGTPTRRPTDTPRCARHTAAPRTPSSSTACHGCGRRFGIAHVDFVTRTPGRFPVITLNSPLLTALSALS
ncbi:hypothetical protein JCM4814A_93670 [Streptomyces phaeofaciens JCM 4814]|uniref:Uncharacterized protein n=1 Tax=Streptomyces phaeofaciens TaxID=68254 RepID=A0A918HQV3_9ACTN|nr:hypothetical protein GCM10010226_89410 [Streptomyces phaeofaciens]